MCLVSLGYHHRFLLLLSSFAVAAIVFSAAGLLDVAGAPAIGVLVLVNDPAVVGGPAVSGIPAGAAVTAVAIILFSVNKVVFSVQ